MKTTKRRKAWVVVDEDDRPWWVQRKRSDAAWLSANETRQGVKFSVVSFVESLPGDVVLSREDVERLRSLVWFLPSHSRRDAIALLRGGR